MTRAQLESRIKSAESKYKFEIRKNNRGEIVAFCTGDKTVRSLMGALHKSKLMKNSHERVPRTVQSYQENCNNFIEENYNGKEIKLSFLISGEPPCTFPVVESLLAANLLQAV
ncbi:hypothetical protein GcM1_160007, partial [Golovinomyces cichoracearum]